MQSPKQAAVSCIEPLKLLIIPELHLTSSEAEGALLTLPKSSVGESPLRTRFAWRQLATRKHSEFMAPGVRGVIEGYDKAMLLLFTTNVIKSLTLSTSIPYTVSPKAKRWKKDGG